MRRASSNESWSNRQGVKRTKSKRNRLIPGLWRLAQYVLANRIPVADSTVATDQRGVPRPASPGDYRDIGAYEASEIPRNGGGGSSSWISETAPQSSSTIRGRTWI